MEFYLNSKLRMKETQVSVHPTSELIVDEFVPIYFVIYNKQRYFQDFMESEEITLINKDNFNQLVEKYYNKHEEYLNKLNMEGLVYVEGEKFNLDTFYVNNNFITVETIIDCCKKFVEMNRINDFVIYLKKDKLLYKNGDFFNIDEIENNEENVLIEDYIEKRVKSQIGNEDFVILYLLEKWVEQEKKKYPRSKKNIEDYFLSVPDHSGYFTFDRSEHDILREKAMFDLGIERFLCDLYGEERCKYLLEIFVENPYIRWKW